MSTFEIKVVKIDYVENHPDADRLSIVKIAGYNCISAKLEDGSHRYKENELCVYISESSILPEWMLKKMGFWSVEKNKGMLAGSNGDRVKPVRLRGIFSEGILYPVENNHISVPMIPGIGRSEKLIQVNEGDDVSEILGITKYQPPIPVHMAGDVAFNQSVTLKYDIENLKKYNKIFKDGEQVVVLEKCHGTFCCLAYVPNLNHTELLYGDYFATSKGMSAAGKFFKNNEANSNNLYHKQLLSEVDFKNQKIKMTEILKQISLIYDNNPVYVLGEIFGQGIQDLSYGESKPVFRVFDVFIGKPTTGKYLNDAELEKIINETRLTRVPALYRGPFSIEKMTELRDGNTTVNNVKQIREGIVIRPIIERENNWIGRTQLKFVSPDYILRKGETTELQ